MGDADSTVWLHINQRCGGGCIYCQLKEAKARIKELEDDRGNWKELASQINTDWIPANKQMSDRIAGLEYVMQEAREVIERQRDERLKLEAENQRLRDTLASVVFGWEQHGTVYTNDIEAVLGGGEK